MKDDRIEQIKKDWYPLKQTGDIAYLLQRIEELERECDTESKCHLQVCREADSLEAKLSVAVEAAQKLLKNGPCSDPDCCDTAKKEASARKNLEEALRRIKG